MITCFDSNISGPRLGTGAVHAGRWRDLRNVDDEATSSFRGYLCFVLRFPHLNASFEVYLGFFLMFYPECIVIRICSFRVGVLDFS